jgi:hypothetical protein
MKKHQGEKTKRQDDVTNFQSVIRITLFSPFYDPC